MHRGAFGRQRRWWCVVSHGQRIGQGVASWRAEHPDWSSRGTRRVDRRRTVTADGGDAALGRGGLGLVAERQPDPLLHVELQKRREGGGPRPVFEDQPCLGVRVVTDREVLNVLQEPVNEIIVVVRYIRKRKLFGWDALDLNLFGNKGTQTSLS